MTFPNKPSRTHIKIFIVVNIKVLQKHFFCSFYLLAFTQNAQLGLGRCFLDTFARFSFVHDTFSHKAKHMDGNLLISNELSHVMRPTAINVANFTHGLTFFVFLYLTSRGLLYCIRAVPCILSAAATVGLLDSPHIINDPTVQTVVWMHLNCA